EFRIEKRPRQTKEVPGRVWILARSQSKTGPKECCLTGTKLEVCARQVVMSSVAVSILSGREIKPCINDGRHVLLFALSRTLGRGVKFVQLTKPVHSPAVQPHVRLCSDHQNPSRLTVRNECLEVAEIDLAPAEVKPSSWLPVDSSSGLALMEEHR